MSDRHSIRITDFIFLCDRCSIALRASTQTLTMLGKLGCSNLCSTSLPRRKKPDRAIRVFAITIWEVPTGVGVDGVRGILPFFVFCFVFFFAFLRFCCFSARGQGRTTAIYCINVEFYSDPVCTNPVRNFPNNRNRNFRRWRNARIPSRPLP